MSRAIKLYKLPAETQIPGLVPMLEMDISGVTKLLNENLRRFKLHQIFTNAEVRHWLLPRQEVVHAFVRHDDAGNVTDFCSFYSLPSRILQHETHRRLNAAYGYYNIAQTVTLKELIHDALILANNAGFDVFNFLDMMDNKSAIDELKFCPGDGLLRYYLYNWKCRELQPNEIGMVLL
eukprot:Selendium_serpulae@DN5120_c0_g1_i4.p1